MKKEAVSRVKREKKEPKDKKDSIEKETQQIEESMNMLRISKAQKNKDQVNRERALFLAAYEYSNKNEID